MGNPEEKYFDDRLMCFLDSLTYDFKTHTGTLHVTAGGCCDMTGCIKLFKSINPMVCKILVYSGAEEDTSYRKDGNKWLAYTPSDGIKVGEIEESYFEE